MPLPADRGHGYIEIQSSPDRIDWTTQASYDLNMRHAEGVRLVDDGNNPVLEFGEEDGLTREVFYRVNHRLEK